MQVFLFSFLTSWSTAEAQRSQGNFKIIQGTRHGSELEGKRLLFGDVRERLFHLTPSSNSKYESYPIPPHQSRLQKLRKRVTSFFVKTSPFNCSHGLLNGCVNPFNYFLLKELPLRLYQIKYIPGYPDIVQYFVNNDPAIKYWSSERTLHSNNTEFGRYPSKIIWNGPMFAKYFHIQQLALINKNAMRLPSSSENVNIHFRPASSKTSSIVNRHHEYVNKSEKTSNGFNFGSYWFVEKPHSSRQKIASSIKMAVPDLHTTNQPINFSKQKPIIHQINAPNPPVWNMHVTQIQVQNVPSDTGKVNISQATEASKTDEAHLNTEMQINENSQDFNEKETISNSSIDFQNSNVNSSSTETKNESNKMPLSPSENSEKVLSNNNENSWANMDNLTIHNNPAVGTKSLETLKECSTSKGQTTEKRVFEFRMVNSTTNVNANIFNIYADNVQVKPTRLNSNIQINSDLPDDKIQEQAYNIELNRTSNDNKLLNIDRSLVYKIIANQFKNPTA